MPRKRCTYSSLDLDGESYRIDASSWTGDDVGRVEPLAPVVCMHRDDSLLPTLRGENVALRVERGFFYFMAFEGLHLQLYLTPFFRSVPCFATHQGRPEGRCAWERPLASARRGA